MASSLVMFAVTLYPAAAEDVILSGTIASAGGEKVVGATVSARPDGSTITTSVFTDAQGNYYFPPMPARQYQVWAQTLSRDLQVARA